MNHKIFPAAMAGVALIAVADNLKNDPVLMTIDNRDVRLSEFKYLYNKNNSQQIEPLTFDQYVDMFVDYKLKVADALEQGVDTTKSFITEFNKFRDELAAPYLRDSVVYENLVNEAYSHFAEDVYVSHVMLPLPSPQAPNAAERIDSIRQEILAGNLKFEDAARQFSIDQGSNSKGGRMGWVMGSSRLPWQFVDVSYQTPVGEISEVVNSGYGLHIIRPEERRKPRGEVSAKHILLLTQGKTDDEKPAIKQRIDSIYQVLTTSSANFDDVAIAYSEDPGSARKGGDLGWFGSGRMVAEFDSVAFALNVGDISTPFSTAYGYHIILKTGQRGDTIPSLDQLRETLEKAIGADSRSAMPTKAKIDQLAQETNSSINPNLAQDIADIFKSNGWEAYDAAAEAALCQNSLHAYTVNGKSYTLGQVIQQRPIKQGSPAAQAALIANSAVQAAYDAELLDYGREKLMLCNEEYRNLINEYRDGIMLFEVSNQKVWDRASKDKDGLSSYFQANKGKYTWDAPRYKAVVVFANNDSILNLAQEFLAPIDPASVDSETLSKDIKTRFGKDIKVERVIAAEGENAITDYLGFGKGKPEQQSKRWSQYFAFGGKIISSPEEADDVKGLVVSDYQNFLEKEWVESLHKTHKVKINKKALKQAQ